MATCPSVKGHIGTTWRIWLNLCILWPTRVYNRYGKWIGSVVFAQLTTESAYTLQWAPYPLELPLPIGDLDLPCNAWCFRSIRVHSPNGTSIGTAVFAQMTAECLYTLQWFGCLWPPYVTGGPLYYCPVVSFLLSIFFFLFFPRLISAAADCMSTILLHMAWP